MPEIFSGIVFAFSGKLSMKQNELKELVEENGGEVSSSITKKTTHLVTTKEDAAAGSSKVTKARENGLPILSEDFVHDSVEQEKLLDTSTYALEAVGEKRKAESSSSRPAKKRRTTKKEEEDEEAEDDEEEEEKPKEEEKKVVKVIAKGKYVVDDHSGLSGTGKVYVEGDTAYTVMLNQTDIKYGQKGHNKYYLIQLIQDGSTYYVFTKWGRVGAKKPQNNLDSFSSAASAKANFAKKFNDKTKNSWENRHKFKPVKGKYIIVDIDYGDEEEPAKPIADTSKQASGTPGSLLEPRVQELMKLISNVKLMQETMREFEIDLNKMPLGKISKKQISDGYKILKQIQDVLNDQSDEDVDELSSNFYSLIPHDFGMNRPPSIDDPKLLKKKMDMLETLADLEVASTILSKKTSAETNPLDAAYTSLNTDLVPIEKNTEEFKLLDEYVQSTHAPTHSSYTLEILDAFKVGRKGEAERFEKSKNIGNRRLLWHGSRTTNFMGILSNGLKIAPPEAPATGYMFGKGIYFADMVSKSANYCFTNPTNNVGCILLADVALGKMYERFNAEYMDKPPKGYDSTWGKGRTVPDPSTWKKLGDVDVPTGKPADGGLGQHGSLMYNEFIVYDIAQANLKYLLKLKFNYKNRY